MTRRRFVTASLSAAALGLLLAAGLAAGPHRPADAAPGRARELLAAAARELGVPVGSLELVNDGVLTLPHLGLTIATAKVRDTETGRFHEVSIDAAGRRADKTALLVQDQAAARARYGTLEPELHAVLGTLREDEPLEVALWLAAPDDPLERPTRDEVAAKGAAHVEAELAARAREKRARLADLQAPLALWLRGIGADVTEVSGLAPVVSARLTRPQLLAAASRPDVEAVYLSRENQPFLNVAAGAVTAPAVWARGITGAGQKVAVIEREGIVFANPYLSGVNRLNTCFGADGYHATMVAGSAASAHGTYRGPAHGATLLGGEACSFADSSLQTATTWARDNGGRAHNNSWGANTGGGASGMSRFHDTVVRDWAVTVLDAAGNCVGGCQVAAPALAYNVIAVGAFDDRNTVSWGDDVMASFSSYIDPSSGHGDREKPEVAAPGVNIITTNQTSPWITPSPGVNGTSFATPITAGGAALLMHRNSTFQFWPEAVKAILMATAVHNVEGASRLSERDGAGGISLDHADQVASDTAKWRTASITPSSFDGTNSLNYTFGAQSGQLVRAVIAWDATPSYSLYGSQPGVDLDLEVYRPSGSLVTTSASWDNTYEIVEFTAPETGTYRLRVVKFRFDDASTFLGVAWKN